MMPTMLVEDDGQLNMTCIYRLPARGHHSTVGLQGRMFVIGGKSSEVDFFADTWYRDYKVRLDLFRRPCHHHQA